MITFLKKIPLTFYSRPFYVDLLRKTRGIGMGFILFMVLLELSYLTIGGAVALSGMLQKLPEFAATLPVTTFKNHKLSIEQPSPYILSIPADKTKEPKTPEVQNFKVVVDTTYAVADTAALEKKMRDESIVILFTGDHYITYKSQGHELRIQSYDIIPDAMITQELWLKWAKWVQMLFGPVMFLMLLFSCFMTTFIKVFIGAIFAALVNLFTKSVDGFGGAMRLAAAAAVPPAIIFLLLPSYGWIKLLIWLGYMVFGAWCARAKAQQPV